MRSRRILLALAVVAAFASACSDVTLFGIRITIEDPELLGSRRIDRERFEFTYRARCHNRGPSAHAVVAVLESTDASTEVVDGVLRCGPVPFGKSAPSLDVFTIRHDRSVPFDPSTLGWIVASIGPLEVERDAVAGDVHRFRSRHRVSVSSGAKASRPVLALLSSALGSIEVVDDRAFLVAAPGTTTVSSDTVGYLASPEAPFEALALSLQILPAGTRAAAVVQTLDGIGHPLGGVRIDAIGSGEAPRTSDDETGFASVEPGPGRGWLRFSKEGYGPVWRELDAQPGRVAVVASPRLVQKEPSTRVGALEETTLTSADGSVRIRFDAGSFSEGAAARVTRLDGQTLPLLLPQGTSPLAAFWLELSSPNTMAGAAEIVLDEPIRDGDRAALVRLDETIPGWRMLATLAPGATASVPLDTAGAFAVVVLDEGPGAPTLPDPGDPVSAGTLAVPAPESFAASARAIPEVSAASLVATNVTALGEVDLSAEAPIPSGVLLQLELDEHYSFQDGRSLDLASLSSFVVAYRRPGDGASNRLRASFPLRPRELFAGDVLERALLRARIDAVSEFSGGLIDEAGGTLSAPGVELLAAPGDVSGTRPAWLDALDPTSFQGLLAEGQVARVAFELAVDGITADRAIRAGFAPQVPNATFVLARVVSGAGREGLEPVERLASDAAGIVSSTEPTSGERLSGIVRGGRYVLVQVPVRPGLVSAAVRGASEEGTLLGVEITGQPWLAIGSAQRAFRLVAPPGPVEGVAREFESGDEGRALGTLADSSSPLALELEIRPTGPRVVEVEPGDGERGVGPVAAIRLRWSEPLAPGSFGPGSLELRDASGVNVESTISLDLSRTRASLLPSSPLAYGSSYTIVVAADLRDARGLALEGDREFSFSTSVRAARGAGAELVIYEPGAATSACDDVPGIDRTSTGIVCVTGSQGSADPDAAVVLVNEATGVTATVRSRDDGSFEGFVEAGVDDFVSAVFVNSNGSRIQLPVSRQIFDDGRIGLFSLGGTIEEQTANGTAELVVEPGAIAGKTVLRLRAIPPEVQQQVIGETPPEIGTLLGQGLVLEATGDPLRVAPDVRIEVDTAALVAQGFDPTKPEEATFALVEPREVDGVIAYRVLDKLEYEDGALVSHSPPFPGPNPSSPDGPGTATDICAQNAGALAVLDELNRSLEMALLLMDPSGLGFVTEKIMFWPLTLAIRSRPVLFTGNVEEVLPGEIGCNVATRPLPGAMVTVRAVTGAGQLSPPRAGRLDPGEAFALADSRGKYAVLLPRLASDEPHAVTAQHPRHVGLRIVEPASEFVMPDPTSFLLSPNDIPNPVSVTDLLFPAPLGNTSEQPPQVTVAHVPLLPAPGGVADVKVFGIHGLGPPQVGLAKKAVKPLGSGTIPTLSDVNVTPTASEAVGATGVRASFDVTSSVPALVILEATASSGGANPTKVEYAIEFGGEEPPPAGGLPASDPDDHVPPIAINTWPADGAVGFTPGLAIEVHFSEPVKTTLLGSPTAVRLSGPGVSARPRLELSPDQMRLEVHSGELEPGEIYTLTLTPSIEDLAGNAFDGDPATGASESLSIQFRTSPIVRSTLPIESGAGAILQGSYAYVLDRAGTTSGALVVIDTSDPDAPVEKARFNLPAFPRDLALISEYPVAANLRETPQERTLVAVVGGEIGGSAGTQGEFTGGSQFLIVVDVTNPSAPTRFASALLTLGSSIVVPRVVWSPPYLGYVESGADLQAVGVIDLQTFAIGVNATEQDLASFPLAGRPGVDANGDGDYADSGEELPLPCRCPGEIAGKVLGFTLGNTTQKILDFALDGSTGAFGAVLSGGRLRDSQGQPTGAEIAPVYRTFFKGGPVPVPQGDLSFDRSDEPKRLRFLPGLPLLVDGVPTPMDVALVSVNRGGAGRIVVIDVTDPFQPKLRNTIDVDPSHGLVQSIELREDGLLAVSTSNDLLLFDPVELGTPQPAAAPHPGFVAKLPDSGSGQRTFMSLAAGLQIVNLGTRTALVQSAPLVSFVRAPSTRPFDPASLAADEPTRDRILADLETVSALFPSRVAAEAGVGSDLEPPLPATHYYVRIDAPGSAGGTRGELPIALESLDFGGEPLRNQGLLYPPVRAMESLTEQQIDETPLAPCDPATEPLRARRISDDPTDPDFNVFLAGPIVLVIEEMPKALLDAVRRSTPERVVLWSGATIRATIDPSVPLSNPVGPFASKVDFARREIDPGAGAFAFTFPGEYLLGPNPDPLVGGAAVPGSFGTVQAHSGEMRLSDLDLELGGRRLGIAWTRTYGAQDLFDGPLGRGWDFYYNQRIRSLDPERFGFGAIPLVDRGDPAKDDVARGGDAIFYDGEGAAILFRNAGRVPPSPDVTQDPLVQSLGWLDPGRVRSWYLPPRGIFELLFEFHDGRFARLTRDGRQFWYEPDGRLTKIVDRYDRNEIELRYNRRGQLVRILDELDRPIDVGWYRAPTDPAFGGFDVASTDPKDLGHIAVLHDYSGRVVRYEYDAHGLLGWRRGPTVTVAALGGFTGDEEVEYLYSGCEDEAKTANAIVGTIEPGVAGTPIASVSNHSGTSRDQVSELSTAAGRVGVTVSGPNTAATLAGKTNRFVGPDGIGIEYLLNGLGQPERITQTGGGRRRVFEHRYNADGLLEEVIHPEGDSIHYVYDSANPALRARANLVTTLRKPPSGSSDPVYLSASPHDARYNLPAGTQTDFAGESYEVFLEPLGREVERLEYPNRDAASFQRNQFGQIELETSADGIVTRTTYGAGGWVETVRVGTLPPELRSYGGSAGMRGLASRIRDPRGVATDLSWNERDELVQAERDGRIEQWGYDALGRDIAQSLLIVPGGVSLPGSPAPPSRTLVERRSFDASGFLERVTIESVEVDHTTTDLVFRLFPDVAKRLARIEYPGGDEKHFFYDGLGQLVRTRIGDTEEAFTYGDDGVLESHTTGGATETYVLDGHRRTREMLHPAGGTTSFRYDGNDRIRSAKVEDPVFGVLSEQEIEYDVRGRQRLVRTNREQGPPSEVTLDFLPALQKTLRYEANGALVEQVWDDAGRTTAITDPTGVRILQLDANGNPLRIDSTESGRTFTKFAVFDDLDQQIEESDPLGLLGRVHLRKDGAVEKILDSRGRVLVRDLSLLGEPLEIAQPNAVVQRRRYDERRRLVTISDASNHTTTNEFDASLRLEQTTMPAGLSVAYSDFDPQGNPQRVLLSNTVRVENVLDDRGRPLSTRWSSFQGLAERREAFAYDALDRVRVLEHPGGRTEIDYDRLGTARETRLELGGVTLRVGQETDPSGNRTVLETPTLVVQETRDAAGRLVASTPTAGTPIISTTRFLSADRIESRTLGGGVLRFSENVDARRRPISRRYEDASGRTLVDLRYVFDDVDDLVARQRLERGGRADLYAYDEGHRLVRLDAGARPALAGESPRALAGFAPSAALAGSFVPGLFARSYVFDPHDVLVGSTTQVPHPVPVPPFASSYGAIDASLHVGEIDGFVRPRDALGSTTRALLQTRGEGDSDPVPVAATLVHDQKSGLVRIEREDGVVVENEFDALGLRTRRSVTCGSAPVSPCTPSDRYYLYHEGLLLEEYEGAPTPGSLVARYHHDDAGEVVAMDRRVGSGGLERFYPLTDLDGSVLGIADSSGRLIERVVYDAFGEATIELADPAAPRVRRVLAGSGGEFFVELSERVLPPIVSSDDASSPETTLADLEAGIELRSAADGAPIAASIALAETEPGSVFGTVLRVVPASPPAALRLELSAGALVDEWRNPIAATSISIASGLAPGSVLFSDPAAGDTAPRRVARSSIDSPLLFHGEVVDYETGLVYLRKRFYQPSTGIFLERDPMPYADGVNAYAGFANNPVVFRDPTGEGVVDVLRVGGRAAARALAAGARAAGRGIRSGGRGIANIGRSTGRRMAGLVDRLDRAATRASGSIDELLNGSYASAPRAPLPGSPVRRVDEVGARARELAASWRRSASASTPEPTVVATGAGGAGSVPAPVDLPPLAARSAPASVDLPPLAPRGAPAPVDLPPLGARPLVSNAEVDRLLARYERVLASQPGSDRARTAAYAQYYPDGLGINTANGTRNCVACQNAFAKNRTGWTLHTAETYPKGDRSGGDVFNPLGEKWAANIQLKEVVARVKAAGPGAEFHLRGIRQSGVVGHRMGVVNNGGTVHFIDAQTRQFARLADRGYLTFWLMRYR